MTPRCQRGRHPLPGGNIDNLCMSRRITAVSTGSCRNTRRRGGAKGSQGSVKVAVTPCVGGKKLCQAAHNPMPPAWQWRPSVLIMGILALLQRCNISGALVSQQAGPREQHLWDVLDEATYQTIAALASGAAARRRTSTTGSRAVRRNRASGRRAGRASSRSACRSSCTRRRRCGSGGSGHVGRRAGLSAARDQECLCHRGRVVSDVGVVESDADHVRVGAGFGGEAELTGAGAAGECHCCPREDRSGVITGCD